MAAGTMSPERIRYIRQEQTNGNKLTGSDPAAGVPTATLSCYELNPLQVL